MRIHVKVKFYVKMSQKRVAGMGYNVNVLKPTSVVFGVVCRFTMPIALL